MLLLTFPCSLHGTMNCSGRSKSLAGRGLRSPACIRIKMAKHVGCFWFRDAIL